VKALVFTGPGTLEMLDVPEPGPAPGEVLVHVRAAGICGSELHGARHPGFRKPPLIMGHEFAGISAGPELLAAVSSWVGTQLSYVPGSSRPTDGAVRSRR